MLRLRRLYSQSFDGIKAKNVRRLLLPAGVFEHELGGTWLNNLNSFGESRGETAHGRTQAIPDPKSELDTVTDIIRGLERIDSLLTALRKASALSA